MKNAQCGATSFGRGKRQAPLDGGRDVTATRINRPFKQRPATATAAGRG
ncbi:hypothetical protein [Kitasatospora azatica]|nr:hypothetical protein [Kitasatospora azatica]